MATTNTQLKKMIAELKTNSPEGVWKRVASDLQKPTRRRKEANLSKISRAIKEGETAIVPGKVLGAGELNKPVTIAAWQISAQALEKIKKAKGTPLGIAELFRKNPKGTGMRIVT